MDLKATYDKIAENWNTDHIDDDWWVNCVNKFISLLKKGDSVLDVGCGSGNGAMYLVDKGLRVTGIDFSEKMIELAQKQNPTEEFKVWDMYNITELEGEFDGVFMRAALLHIPKKDVHYVLQNTLKKLKPGGYIYISVKEIWENQPGEEIKKDNDYGYEYERFFSYFTMEELEEHLKDLSIEIVHEEVTKCRNTNWLQIVGRKTHLL